MAAKRQHQRSMAWQQRKISARHLAKKTARISWRHISPATGAHISPLIIKGIKRVWRRARSGGAARVVRQLAQRKKAAKIVSSNKMTSRLRGGIGSGGRQHISIISVMWRLAAYSA